MTSRVPVLTAVPEPSLEANLVAGLSEPGSGVVVAGRCVDLAELLAAAASGRAVAALVSEDLHGLDLDAVARMRAAGVAVVAVVTGRRALAGEGRDAAAAAPAAAPATDHGSAHHSGGAPAGASAATIRLARLGVHHVVGSDSSPADVAAALRSAVWKGSGPDGRPAEPAVPGSAASAVSPGSGLQPGAFPPGPAVEPGSAFPPGPAFLATASPLAPDPAYSAASATARPQAPPAWSPDHGAVEPADPDIAPQPSTPPQPGQLVAVWGPTGAPGRTTLACTLAAELALAGCPTLLIDADTYGGTVSQQLGLGEDSPGLVAATRAAGHGMLDAAALQRLVRRVPLDSRAGSAGAELGVLAGILRADRWPEIGEAALVAVLEVARLLVPRVVVDVGFCLEADEALSYDLPVPRRNGATLATLEQADSVLAVGTADPVGLARLVRGLAELAELRPGRPALVVLNRDPTRAGAGRGASGEAGELLERLAGMRPVARLPEDRSAVAAALARGRLLAEAAPRSPLRLAVRDLAAELARGGPSRPSHRRLARWRPELRG